MAQLRRLEEKFSQELVIIGVHSAKFPAEHVTENIRQALLRHGIHHPVVNDTGFRIWDEYAVRGWPTLVLIGPNGRIADKISGEILAEAYAEKIHAIIQNNPDGIRREPQELSPESQPETEQLLRFPAKLLLGSDRILFIADSGHHRILRVTLNPEGTRGEIDAIYGSAFPGLKDGDAPQAQFNHPHGLALRGDAGTGTLYVADTENHAIRAVDLKSGQVRTVAGTGQKAHGGYRLGDPRQTPLRSPWALAVLDLYLLIAMAGSHQVWVLIDEKQLGPFAGTGAEALQDGPPNQAAFNQPSDLAFGLGHLFVADAEASAVRVIRLDEDPRVTTLVGQGLFEFGDRDGVGSEVRLQHAAGLAVDGDLVYIADTYNHKIKRFDPSTGQVSTLAGSGKPGLADGDFAQARFYEPEGLQVAAGRIYVADTNNHAIRVAVLETHRVETLQLYYRAGLSPQTQSAQWLDAVRVSPGRARFTLEPRLPPAHKRNPESEATLAVGEAPGHLYRFAPDQEILFEMELYADTDLRLGITLLYCETDAARLCRIDSRNLILPIKVTPGASTEARIPYTISI